MKKEKIPYVEIEKFASLVCKDTNVPYKAAESFLKKIDLYELTDIKEIKDNYQTISSSKHLPLTVWIEVIKTAFKGILDVESIFDKNLKHTSDENLKVYGEMSFGSFIKPNFNLCLLENVYLNNFEFTKNDYFEAVEFDILDIRGDKIKGVFMYNSPGNTEGEKKESVKQC